MIVRGVARLRHGDLRPAQLAAGDRRDLASQADHRQQVAAVGLDVDVEHDVTGDIAERRAERRVRGQDQDALGVRRQPELRAGAEHALALRALDRRHADAPVARQYRTGERHRHALTGLDVVCAAHDRQRLVGVRDADLGQVEPVSARMWHDLEQLADHDRVPVGADALDALDLQAEQRQPLGEPLGRQVEVDVVAQPGKRDAHGLEALQEAQVVLEEDAQVRGCRGAAS